MKRDLLVDQYVDILVRPKITLSHAFTKYGEYTLYGKRVSHKSDSNGENYVLEPRVEIGNLILRNRAAAELIERLILRGPSIYDEKVNLKEWKKTQSNDFASNIFSLEDRFTTNNLNKQYSEIPEGSNYFTKVYFKFDPFANQDYVLLTMDNGKVLRLEIWSNKYTYYGRNKSETYPRISVNQSTVFIMSFINQYGPKHPATKFFTDRFYRS